MRRFIHIFIALLVGRPHRLSAPARRSKRRSHRLRVIIHVTRPTRGPQEFWADALGGTVVSVGTDKREVIRIPKCLDLHCVRQAAKGSSKGSTADLLVFGEEPRHDPRESGKANGFRVATAENPPAAITSRVMWRTPGPGPRLAFVFGPDDVKVELLEQTIMQNRSSYITCISSVSRTRRCAIGM
jgi:hypothetical protein